jgi:hypothetical protein
LRLQSVLAGCAGSGTEGNSYQCNAFIVCLI